MQAHFNPRAPYGARRHGHRKDSSGVSISIHAPHTGRDYVLCQGVRLLLISIHAPHTGRDYFRRSCVKTDEISIHAPHTGRDSQSDFIRSSILYYFNPRAPYGARPVFDKRLHRVNNFNPRAPYGARRTTPQPVCPYSYFNPRAPYGARLWLLRRVSRLFDISIHAPHTGRDDRQTQRRYARNDFNPRAPYGARRTCGPRRPGRPADFNPRAPYGARPFCTY